MFKLPSLIPQDLLLIQDLVKAPEPAISLKDELNKSTDDDSSCASSKDADSEDEIDESLVVKAEPTKDALDPS